MISSRDFFSNCNFFFGYLTPSLPQAESATLVNSPDCSGNPFSKSAIFSNGKQRPAEARFTCRKTAV